MSLFAPKLSQLHAGMVVSGAETPVAQNRIALAEAGISAADIETYCRALGDAFNASVNGTGMPRIEDYDLPGSAIKLKDTH